MELKNYVEDVVREVLDDLLRKREDICGCDQCRGDIMAYALNRLPTAYATTDLGKVVLRFHSEEADSRAVILRELLSAIEKVSRNPRHGKEGEEQ
ncbi:MAG: late competence development ComFB family protein [bacterium]